MSLGVLNNLSAMYAENNLNNTSNSLNTVLEQLSSGSKINSGADDAAGLSLVDGLAANSAALTQSATNAQEGVGLLKVADGALSQVTNLLNRAVTLATEVSNGTLNDSQESAANKEYQSILSEIDNIGSTTTYNQKSVFGASTDIYAGDSSSTGASIDSLNIGTLSSANVGDTNGQMSYSSGQTSSNVFIDLSNDGTEATVNDSLGASTATTSIDVSYLAKGAGGATVTKTATITVGDGTSYSNTVSGLLSAINGSGLGLTASLTTAQNAGTSAVAAAEASNNGGGGASDMGIEISGVGVGVAGADASQGATTNGVGVVGTLSVANADDTLSGTLNIVGSDGTSHKITLGTDGQTDTLQDLAATLNAAGYGVTVTNPDGTAVTSASTELTFKSATSAVSISGTGITDIKGATPGDNDPLATVLGNVPTPNAEFSSTVGTLTSATTYDANLGNGSTIIIGSQTITLNNSDDTLATLAATINSGDYGVTATYSQANKDIVFTSSNSAMQISTNIAGATATLSSENTTAAAGSTDSAAYYSTGIATSTGIVDYSTVVGSGANATYGGTGVYSAGANAVAGNTGIVSDLSGNSGTATISYTDAAGADLSKTDLSSQADARSALTALNTAISDVAAQDGYLGAQINTLTAISSVLSTQQQNVVAAQNAVQATDYASATSAMSKYEILSQTGIAALAQANSQAQEVTKLLQ